MFSIALTVFVGSSSPLLYLEEDVLLFMSNGHVFPYFEPLRVLSWKFQGPNTISAVGRTIVLPLCFRVVHEEF